jgi:membrane protein YqaA with SNARE-associated domain
MIFFASEVIFGLIPPEFFMLVWILHGVSIPQYVINLTILTLISYLAGIIGYFIGKNLSKTHLYNRIYERYLQAYEGKLKKYGGFLVIVGATTPVPYSATCMLAGSINLPFRYFLVICITRIVRFSVYGWMVWKFPVWFS